MTFTGQRDPQQRLAKVPFDFTNKTVLDIGSNQGGMLFAIKDKIRWGVGVDYDYRMVNASNLIAKELDVKNTSFFVFDIDKDPHELLQDFLPEQKVDIVFLLAVCMWVKKWRELIDMCASISENMLFESNGTDEQQREQYDYLQKKFNKVSSLAEQSDDDPLHKGRKLYLASNDTVTFG